MERWLILKIQSLLLRHPPVETGAVRMARWGFWVYILYGLVQWFRPGKLPQQFQRRQSMTEALLSVGISSFFSFLIFIQHIMFTLTPFCPKSWTPGPLVLALRGGCGCLFLR